MSGRSGYRKTDRKQSRPRPKLDPTVNTVRVTFSLPNRLAFAVGSGKHGYNVNVIGHGHVQVEGRNTEHAFRLAADFLRSIAGTAFPFSMSSVLTAIPSEKRCDTYEIVYCGGYVVIARTMLTPMIFDPK